MHIHTLFPASLVFLGPFLRWLRALWPSCMGIAPCLHTDRVDEQDAETGLLAPVLKRPPRFRGVRVANLSSQEDLDFLSVEI